MQKGNYTNKDILLNALNQGELITGRKQLL